MKFKYKADWWLNCIAVIIFGLPVFSIGYGFVSGQREGLAAGVVWLFIFALIILPAYVLTSYEIKDSVLIIKSGLFFKKRISIADIKTIAPSHHPLSSAVMPSHRIAVYYANGNRTASKFISPAEKEEFIKALIDVNPNITNKTT
ncbi:MAG: PH domain-containing protein [Clostridia bacterium]|nr:PH domain-containing protein [Clostridia bacterium]